MHVREGQAAAENVTSMPLVEPMTYDVLPPGDTAYRALDPAMPVATVDCADVSIAPFAATRATVKLPVEVVADVASADQHVRVSASRADDSASPPCELETSPVHA